ncbi:MAG: isochorismatase family protein [Chloroflexi bacterium]|nr:isochorismatase family protein [Chloroflexota bacterium]
MKRPLSIDPSTTAALFVDLQEEHRQDERYLVAGFDRVVANVRRLQECARAAGIPVFHSAYVVDLATPSERPYHPVLPDGRSAFSDKDDPRTVVCAEVGPVGDEPLLIKAEASAFGAKSLADDLRSRGVVWLMVAGVWTEACIAATVRDALALGFRVMVVKDACASGTEAMHQTAILNLANRLYGGAVVATPDAMRLMDGQTIDAWQVQGSVPLRFTYTTAAALYEAM